MDVIMKPTAELVPYIKNPRRNDKAVAPVAESIRQFGFKVPLVIDRNNEVVCGHTRLRAARRLHIKEVPCVVADDLSEEQIKAFRLADNKTAEFAEWDFDLLNGELLDIKSIDMCNFGFDLPEPVPEEDGFDVDAALAEIGEAPASKPGKLYQLGRHFLLCGDSTSMESVEKLTAGRLMDMVFTDPPYNIAYGESRKRKAIANDDMPAVQFKNFLDSVFTNYSAVMKPGAPFYVCYADKSTQEFRQAIVDSGLLLKQQLVWCKNAFTLGRQDYQWQHEPILYGWKPGAKHKWYGGRKLSTVITENYPVELGQDADGHTLVHINVGLRTVVLRADNVEAVDTTDACTMIYVDKPTKSAEHPTMKPIALCAKCIRVSSKQGDAVMDLFGGSGSTLIACEQINRQCFTMELDPVYCDVIIRRWEKLTGQKAELVSA